MVGGCLPPISASATGPIPTPTHRGGRRRRSSACLVTSIVGCVLHHFGVLALPAAGTGAGQASEPALQAAHAVAQFSHCYAQGKVGSGFDVCAAVYGSGVYRRFDPAVLASRPFGWPSLPVSCVPF